jgi:pterin-4a-carbinolamine dehydratase
MNQNVSAPKIAMQESGPGICRQFVRQFGTKSFQTALKFRRNMANVGTKSAFGPELWPIVGPQF